MIFGRGIPGGIGDPLGQSYNGFKISVKIFDQPIELGHGNPFLQTIQGDIASHDRKERTDIQKKMPLKVNFAK